MTSRLMYELPPPKVRGLIQETPLLISSIIEHASKNHKDREIVSRMPEGYIDRSTYGRAAQHSKQLANALRKEFNIREGDVIGTLAFNHIYHFECYFGISGIGAILHTINPRLFPEQLEYIIDHAQDTMLFIDVACVQIFASFLKSGKHRVTCQRIVILTAEKYYGKCAETLKSVFTANYSPQLYCYETLIKRHSSELTWPVFHETAASSLCYTSGTTGHPKGVLYSHRSTVLHAMAGAGNDSLGAHSGDVILSVVPLFHVNAWGLPYLAAIAGVKFVLPGIGMDGKSLTELIINEGVTVILGVPTVYLGLFQYWDSPEGSKLKFPALHRIVVGGSAAPESMVRRFRKMGVVVNHAWGMTETSPIGTSGVLLPKHAKWSEDKVVKVLLKQGRAVFNVDMRIVGADGKPQPRDGKAFGELQVRGPWITKAYYRVNKKGSVVDHGKEDPNVDADNWFDTGDVATIDADGYMQITDRTKDVIKSGGEWISSIDIENICTGLPAVAEACVIGHKHTKWQERPLLLIVKKEGKEVSREEIREFLKPKIASWWMPNGIEFVKELPHTATGKLSKLTVRQQFKDYCFQDDPQFKGNPGQEETRPKSKL